MPKSITTKIVECRTPGGLTLRMERWFYENIRNALLEILPEPGSNAELYELQKRVASGIDTLTEQSVESLTWMVAWVRLDLEQEGILDRDAAYVTRLK